MSGRLRDFADYLVILYGWKRGLAALLAGGFAALALPPFFLLPALVISLPILALLLDGADADPPVDRKSRRVFGRPGFFWTGWWFGFGWFLVGLSWITEALLVDADAHAWLIPFALLFIPGGLAFFHAIACGVAGFFWPTGAWRLVVLASSLAGFEWLRGVLLTGFPWNGLNLALAGHDWLIQGFAVTGAPLATLLLALVALAPATLWPHGIQANGSKLFILACAAIACGWVMFGAARVLVADAPVVEEDVFRVVQPNIAQVDKWDPSLAGQHLGTLLQLTSEPENADDLAMLGATHVVWPESAFPFLIAERPDALRQIAQALPIGTTLISGAVRSHVQFGERVFGNSVFAFNDRGEIIDAYDKVRLVPFGEMLPFSRTLDRLGIRALVGAPAGFVPGPDPTPIRSASGFSSLPLICYEVVFASFVRKGILAHRPRYLLNVTNDAWFGASAGPHQHFHQARLRSVETGVPMVRSANTGISAIIDGKGRVVASIPLAEQGVLAAPLPGKLDPTPYLKFGDLPFTAIIALVALVSLYLRLTNRHERASARV